jgi:hypothetical protein
MGHSHHARSNPTGMRRIGILIEATADPDLRSCVEPFDVGLRELGWTGGRNVQDDLPLGRGAHRAEQEEQVETFELPAGRHRAASS